MNAWHWPHSRGVDGARTHNLLYGHSARCLPLCHAQRAAPPKVAAANEERRSLAHDRSVLWRSLAAKLAAFRPTRAVDSASPPADLMSIFFMCSTAFCSPCGTTEVRAGDDDAHAAIDANATDEEVGRHAVGGRPVVRHAASALDPSCIERSP